MSYSPNAWTVCLLSIIFLGLLSIVVSPVWAQQTLENPQPESVQSGIGVISGWACDANQIEIEFDNDSANRWRAGTGTLRTDTQGVCGDTDNGFGLLFNWNRLGDGIHTVRALADGVEFASVIVIVSTLEEEFLRGASGEVPVADFPTSGDTRILRWQEAQQNFVITDGSPVSRGGGTSGSPPRVLENPSPGSFQSGIGVVSGWVCEAAQIEIEFNNDAANRWTAGYRTPRSDTQSICGDTDNGFGLLFNWNRLGDGTHTVRAFADGVEFANVTVTVNTLGEEFSRGLSHEVTVADFPQVGTDLILVWQQTQQNFVIAAALPTQQLVAVTPVVTFPEGVTIPNVAVRSLYAETAEVLARPEPSLLIATDSQGSVLVGFANMNGGLQGERPGVVEISVDSTAIVLVALAAGYSVHAIDQSVVDEIRAHPTYQALISAMSMQLAVDKNFLEHLLDYTDIRVSLQAVAGDIANSTQGDGTVRGQATGSPLTDTDSDLRRRLLVAHFAAAVANALLPTEAIQRALQILMTRQNYEPTYSSCVSERIRQRTTSGGPRALSPPEVIALPSHPETLETSETIWRGIAGALQDAGAAIDCEAPPTQGARAVAGSSYLALGIMGTAGSPADDLELYDKLKSSRGPTRQEPAHLIDAASMAIGGAMVAMGWQLLGKPPYGTPIGLSLMLAGSHLIIYGPPKFLNNAVNLLISQAHGLEINPDVCPSNTTRYGDRCIPYCPAREECCFAYENDHFYTDYFTPPSFRRYCFGIGAPGGPRYGFDTRTVCEGLPQSNRMRDVRPCASRFKGNLTFGD